jgi:hypothetical protein
MSKGPDMQLQMAKDLALLQELQMFPSHQVPEVVVSPLLCGLLAWVGQGTFLEF